MKKFLKFPGMFLLTLLIILPCFSQNTRYNGPDDGDSFFPIGWSKNGSRFAYGWFETTQMISNGSSISIVVQDLITDKFLFQGGKTWDEGNVGDGGNYYPQSAKEAWKLVANKSNKKFVQLGIRKGARIFRFPIGSYMLSEIYEQAKALPVVIEGNKKANIKIKIIKVGADYQIYAISDKLGQKMISSIKKSDADQTSVEGYVVNPNGTRIGLILNKRYDGPYSEYRVIGCHLKVGFKKSDVIAK